MDCFKCKRVSGNKDEIIVAIMKYYFHHNILFGIKPTINLCTEAIMERT